MRRTLRVAVAAVALCVSQLPASTAIASFDLSSAGSLGAAAAAPQVRTPFALAGAAYGTRVQGGSLPANSDDTAYQRIGCTNVAGKDRVNFVAEQTVPGLGKLEGVRSRVWTSKVGDTVSSYSRHTIASLTIGSRALGAIEIQGIRATAQAFNRGGRFGTALESDVGRIVLRVAGQPAQTLPVPAPGRTLTVPGVASITLGTAVRRVTRDSAKINANVLDVRVIPLGTRATVAQTNATIQGGIKQGVFEGYAAGVQGRGLGDTLKLGRTPLTLVPCRGGEEQKDLASVSLGDLGGLSGLSADQRTVNRPLVATGRVVGRVARANLFDGRVKLRGIAGVANVQRAQGKLTRSTKGSTVGELTIDGETRSFPATGTITVPGLVELDNAVVQRTTFGLKVVGLRATVLDGSGAVIDLGIAQLGIRPGVRPRR